MAHRKPKIDEKMAGTMAHDIYGLTEITEVKELISFYDINFQVKTRPNSAGLPNRFVLKVLNSSDSQHPECILAEVEAMEFLRSKGFPCPKVFPVYRGNEFIATVNLDDSEMNNIEAHVVRLISFLDGTTADKIVRNPDLLYTIGTVVGSTSKQLKEFSHEGIKLRTSLGFKWNILEFLDIEKYINSCNDIEEIRLIREVHAAFMTKVKPQLGLFRSGTIHNDLNGQNILVSNSPYRLTGIIDFGDMVTSLLISELSNSMAFFMEGDCGVEFSGYLLAGYNSVFPLPDEERELLYYFVAARLCQLIMYSNSNLDQGTTEENVQACLQKYNRILVDFWGRKKHEVEEIWRLAEIKSRALK
ncbi:hydroxylysine kinase [Exaiptasia diaphana]|uniref:Hydroxylysine kinase n=1 Tax=Exaiptasia diaphana TaxID=2652724 RepID=A0A913XD52_EXADI|nr:hydroxylysine kinase [Exaiptasia diaphana]KXJ29665.1 Hydroxylysine kinase [Exaiptasia diaphana]